MFKFIYPNGVKRNSIICPRCGSVRGVSSGALDGGYGSKRFSSRVSMVCQCLACGADFQLVRVLA